MDDTESNCAGKVLLGFKDVRGLKHASLVCKQNHCGSAVSTEAAKMEYQGLLWHFFSDCDGSESALIDCGTVSQLYSSTAIHVTCTGEISITRVLHCVTG